MARTGWKGTRSPIVHESVNEVFNIGADQPYSVLELATVVATTLGRAAEVVYLPPRTEVLHAFSDHAKARRVFGDLTPVSLEAGIARMAEWALERGPTPPVDFTGTIELDRDLPPIWRPSRRGE